jgi:hypothetical protein
MSRHYIVLVLCLVACGGRVRTDIDSIAGSAGRLGAGDRPVVTAELPSPAQGGLAGLGSTPSATGGGGVAGQNSAGGAAPTGKQPIGGGSDGGVAALDDPVTLGDERAGVVQCWKPIPGSDPQVVTSCAQPLVCCVDGHCVADKSECNWSIQACDGDEDCPSGEHCCRATQASVCQAQCTAGSIHHVACGGVCADWDGDMIPDAVDTCTINQIEDGRGPETEDGCRDTDYDGVRDGKDQCPVKKEDGLPPEPKDGCPN